MLSHLTREEYISIAASLSLPTGAVINGRSTASLSGSTFETYNPSTQKLISRIAACDKADIDEAVLNARRIFESGIWSKAHPTIRKKSLLSFVKLLRRNSHELAVLESIESGKPIFDIETIDIPEMLNCLEWHAETADKIYDQLAPAGNDNIGMIVREPIGVVGCVLPWNFPLLMLAWKIGPALAAGNSVIAKPSELTSMSTIRVCELAHEAGIPPGVFQVITGTGEIAGKELGMHPDIDMITFTGSTEIGRKFLEYSAKSNLKRITLECGGKNPCIVMEDVVNIDLAAQHIVQAAFWNMGENCSATSRVIVHAKIKKELIDRILYHIQSWPMGDPLDPENRLGAIISKEQYDKIQKYIAIGHSEGAKAITGSQSKSNIAGQFIEPIIFDDVTPEMFIARDEIFGPVLSILTVNNLDQAISIANDTNYGLTASVFSRDITQAHRLARSIKAGTVTVNCYGEGDMTTPFGGYKQSGFGGRDKSVHAHDQYTQLKTIWVDISDRAITQSID